MRNGGLDWHRDDKALREPGYSTNLIGQEAAAIIDRHDPQRPLFLYVPFNAPHSPLQAPEEYLAKYADIKQPKRQKYAAMVTCLDDAVKRILAALDKRGMRENTLILFSSDNGGPTKLGANNFPLRGAKGSLYEGGVRVPAFAVWSGKLPAGKVAEAPMHMVDWYPTLAKLVGASLESSQRLDGFDVWGTIAKGQPSPRKDILHNVTPRNGALRQGDWKLVVQNRQNPTMRTLELFNLADDPYEKNNLAEAEPKRAREMLTRLMDYAHQAEPPKGGQGAPPKGFKVPKVWGERNGGNLGE